MQTKEIKERCDELLSFGMTVKEVKNTLLSEYNQTYDVSQRKYTLKQSGRTVGSTDEVVEGDKEYTPKSVLTEKGYKVNYSDTYVEATHEEIRKAFMMYCIGKLTMNGVALKMGWTRAEFNAIRTAFHITKDGEPFTPYEIDQLDAEQMAELKRIEKKRYSQAKFEMNKHKDIEKEIKRYNEADYFVKRVAELFNAKEPVVFNAVEVETEDTDVLVYNIRNTDIHGGSIISSVYGEYNLDIVKEYFEYQLSWIRKNIPKGSKIILSDGGDTVHGLIHGSTEKHGTYTVIATMKMISYYETHIEELLKDYTIVFVKVDGNHESLEKNPKNRTEEENLGNLITFAIERIFSKCDNLTVIKKLKGLPHAVINIVPGFDVLLDHGDTQRNFNKYIATANKLNNMLGCNIKEVWLGHLHQYLANNPNNPDSHGILVERTEAFTPSDQYAAPKGLTNKNGFRVVKYGKNGRLGHGKLIEFK